MYGLFRSTLESLGCRDAENENLRERVAGVMP